MIEHLDENTLELYILKSGQIADRQSEIEAHLKQCPGCSALYQEISDYYTQVDHNLEEFRHLRSALALSERATSVPVRKESIPGPLYKRVPAQIFRFVREHKVASALNFAALLIILGLLFFPRRDVKDLNPSYARSKDEFLVVYNKDGEVLWKKHIGQGYDIAKHLDDIPNGSVSLENVLVTADVNNDGENEVVAIFGWSSELKWRNVIKCYNADGKDRWDYVFHRNLKFGNQDMTDSYGLHSMIVDDFEKDGTMEVMALAGHSQYYPTALVKIDASTGKLLSEYWHSGHVKIFVSRDFDGDGNKEILLGGVNNGYNLASVAVIDPRRLQGHSPAPPAYAPIGIADGSERYYILFPRTDLKKFAGGLRNTVMDIWFPNTGPFTVGVDEPLGQERCPIIYSFDSKMRCVGADGHDSFVTLHRKLESEGKVSRKIGKEYYEELQHGVLYWDGERFVNEPTSNSHYEDFEKVTSNQ
jgi:hypothetical protein